MPSCITTVQVCDATTAKQILLSLVQKKKNVYKESYFFIIPIFFILDAISAENFSAPFVFMWFMS